MNNARDTIEQYRAVLQERKTNWKSRYCKEIFDALDKESTAMADSLEAILILDPTRATKSEKSLARLTYPESQFYLDPKYASWGLDEGRLPKIRSDEKDILWFIARENYSTNKGSRTYHHTTSSGRIREFLFNYWKEHSPSRLRILVERTVKSANNSRHSAEYYVLKHLDLVNVCDITYERLEDKGYLNRHFDGNSPFRDGVNQFVRDMVQKDMLIVTPGYVHTAISIPRKYLRKKA